MQKKEIGRQIGIQIRKIVLGSLFAAIAIVLKSGLSIKFGSNMRIGFFQIPLLLGGYFLGPVYGLATGIVCDTVYALTAEDGMLFSLFTLSTIIWGPAGWLIRKLSKNPQKLIPYILVITVTSIMQTAINTLAMIIYYGSKDVFVYLPWRILSLILGLPILIGVTRGVAVNLLPFAESDFPELRTSQ